MMKDSIPEPECPFGPGFVCVEGYRYKPTPGLRPREMAKPLLQDLDGLLFVGKCDCCVKATGGVR